MARRSIYDTRWTKQPRSPICLSVTTPRDPRFTALLDGILTGQGPTVYSLRLCIYHWNILRCHDWCKWCHKITNLSGDESVIQRECCHRHRKFLAGHRFWLNLTHSFRLDSIHRFWLDLTPSANIDFWFESAYLSPIPVKLQGVPHRQECPEYNSTVKLWNIPQFLNSNCFWQGHSNFSKNYEREGKVRKQHPNL